MNEDTHSDNTEQIQFGQPKKSRKGLKVFSLALLFLLVLAGTAYGVYAWQQQEIDRLNAKINSLEREKKNKSEEKRQDATNPQEKMSDNEKVIAAFYYYCNLSPLPHGYERDNIIGTVTQEQQEVVYSNDSQFAAINGRCGIKKAGTTNEGGGALLYILKQVEGVWSVIVPAQQRPSDVQIKLYGIPEEFLTTLGLSR